MDGQGLLITLEGGEGTGKSTQASLLQSGLERAGHKVLRTREPGGSPLAERIRVLILSGAFKELGPDVEATMFAAARSDHLSRTIRPAMERGEIVICDRFFDSTRVYQAISGATPSLLDELREEATNGIQPDLTIVLDLDENEASRRASIRRGIQAADRFEQEGREFHAQVRRGFLDIASKEPHRCVVVDASGPQEEVAARLMEAVTDRALRGQPSFG